MNPIKAGQVFWAVMPKLDPYHLQGIQAAVCMTLDEAASAARELAATGAQPCVVPVAVLPTDDGKFLSRQVGESVRLTQDGSYVLVADPINVRDLGPSYSFHDRGATH